MGNRRVPLPDDAYERLDAERRPDESFGNVVRRLTESDDCSGSDDLLDYVGVLDDEAADELEAAIEEARERRGRTR